MMVKQKRVYRRQRNPEVGLAQIQHVLSSPPKQFKLQTSPMPISPSYRAKVSRRCLCLVDKGDPNCFPCTVPTFFGTLCRARPGYSHCQRKSHLSNHTHLLANSKLHPLAYLCPQVRFWRSAPVHPLWKSFFHALSSHVFFPPYPDLTYVIFAFCSGWHPKQSQARCPTARSNWYVAGDSPALLLV